MKFEIVTPYQFPLSIEQQTAYNGIMEGKSIAVPACAGSGKSHTARAIAKNYAGTVESVPFSRALSDEEISVYAGFSNINSLNFHRRGIRLCGNVEVDNKKLEKIATLLDAENALAIENLARYAKLEGVGIYDKAMSIEDIATKYGIGSDEESEHAAILKHAATALEMSDKITNAVDFEDMLRMPVLKGVHMPLQGLVILDEVQDYTPLAWTFLKKCLVNETTQVLMIGDFERQLLMAFAGARAELFMEIAEYFKCEIVKFTVNRRCSKAVVEAAPFRGDMVALPDAPQGEVGTKVMADVLNEIAQGKYATDALLSETNAPLVQFGLQLLAKNVKVQMRVGKLDKMIIRYTYGKLDTRKVQVGQIAELLKKELAEAKANGEDVNGEFEDVIKCVEALELFCLSKGIVKPTFVRVGRAFRPVHPIQQALAMLVEGKEGITLLTGHTSKGLEWNTVFHIPGNGKPATQNWQEHQQSCLSHVIATRAKYNFYRLG